MLEIEPQVWDSLGRYLGAGLAVGIGAIGAGMGEGLVAGHASQSIMRQPKAEGEVLRNMLIGQALGGETGAIFALVVGMLIMFVDVLDPAVAGGNFVAACVGAGLAVGLGSIGSGIGGGAPGAAACEAIARNPRRQSRVVQGMIVGQAVAQSSVVMALVIGLLLFFLFQLPGTDWVTVGLCLGAGIAMGASALGPGMGAGQAAGGAMRGISRWPASFGVTMRMMLIGQGGCGTPAVFGMLVALIMMFGMRDIEPGIIGFSKLIGAGIAAGFAGIGPGIGSGFAADKACEATAEHPEDEPALMRTMLIGQAVSQSTCIYGLIIALVILYAM